MSKAVEQWVEEVGRLTRPHRIHWCDGSEAENQHLVEAMLESGTLHPLTPKPYPSSSACSGNTLPGAVAPTPSGWRKSAIGWRNGSETERVLN